MADFLTKAERSHRMSLIRGKNTTPEKMMSSLLRRAKIRFRRHGRMIGTPDFVIGRLVVFVDGTFWHGKRFDKWKAKLSPWWQNKIANNKRRDARVDACLRRRGFSVVHCWEDDLRRRPEVCIKKIKSKMEA